MSDMVNLVSNLDDFFMHTCTNREASDEWDEIVSDTLPDENPFWAALSNTELSFAADQAEFILSKYKLSV